MPGSHKLPFGIFPPSSQSPVDAGEVSSRLMEALNNAIKARDVPAIKALFHDNSYWRDHLCLSWDLRTFKGSDKISDFVANSPTNLNSLDIDWSSDLRSPKQGPIDGLYGPASEVSGIEFFVKVSTDVGSGRGVVKLAEVDGQWKFFTVFTTLKGIEEPRGKHLRSAPQWSCARGAYWAAELARQTQCLA